MRVRHQFDNARHGGLGIVRLDEIEVAVALGLGQIGQHRRLMRCALVMIRLWAAWRKISVSRTTGTAPEAMMSAST